MDVFAVFVCITILAIFLYTAWRGYTADDPRVSVQEIPGLMAFERKRRSSTREDIDHPDYLNGELSEETLSNTDERTWRCISCGKDFLSNTPDYICFECRKPRFSR